MVDDETRAKALELKAEGVPQRVAAEQLGLSRGAYRRAIGAPGVDATSSPAAIDPENGLPEMTAAEAIEVLQAARSAAPTSNGSGTVDPSALRLLSEPGAVEPVVPGEPVEAPAGPLGWIDRELDGATAAIARQDLKTAAAFIDRARGRAAVEGIDVEDRIAAILSPPIVRPADDGGAVNPAEPLRASPREQGPTVNIPGIGPVETYKVISAAMVLVGALSLAVVLWQRRGTKVAPAVRVAEAVGPVELPEADGGEAEVEAEPEAGGTIFAG